MPLHQLRQLLDAEVKHWSGLSYGQLIDELDDVVAYPGERKELKHQFEVQIIEHEPDYVHVCGHCHVNEKRLHVFLICTLVRPRQSPSAMR